MNMGYGRETMRVKGVVGRVHLSCPGQPIYSNLVGRHAEILREGFLHLELFVIRKKPYIFGMFR